MTGMSMIALRNQTVAREFFPSFDSANGCLLSRKIVKFQKLTCSGRSRPSDKGGGDSHPDPEIRGRGGGGLVSKKIFVSPSGLSLV